MSCTAFLYQFIAAPSCKARGRGACRSSCCRGTCAASDAARACDESTAASWAGAPHVYHGACLCRDGTGRCTAVDISAGRVRAGRGSKSQLRQPGTAQQCNWCEAVRAHDAAVCKARLELMHHRKCSGSSVGVSHWQAHRCAARSRAVAAAAATAVTATARRVRTIARVAALGLGLRHLTRTEARVDDARLADDKAVLDELADVLACSSIACAAEHACSAA